MIVFVHCYLLGGIAFENTGVHVMFGGGCIVAAMAGIS
jgi:hypothetical protein